jgi:uncharacterized surface protein with fasciclin (FAS1) repeats
MVALAFGGVAFAQEAKPQEPPKKADAPKMDDKAKDIVAVAMDAKFNTLVDLLKAAGLADELKKPGPFTVFAPTDEAFAKLGKDLDDLKKPENKAKLAAILKRHVVSGRVMAADVLKMDGKTAKPLAGDEIKIAVKDGKVMLDGKANVTKTDVAASNGVIHVIDTVLVVPAASADKPAMKDAKHEHKAGEKHDEGKPAEKKQ